MSRRHCFVSEVYRFALNVFRTFVFCLFIILYMIYIYYIYVFAHLFFRTFDLAAPQPHIVQERSDVFSHQSARLLRHSV